VTAVRGKSVLAPDSFWRVIWAESLFNSLSTAVSPNLRSRRLPRSLADVLDPVSHPVSPYVLALAPDVVPVNGKLKPIVQVTIGGILFRILIGTARTARGS